MTSELTSPLGCISKAEDKFRSLLASKSAFQQWDGNAWSESQAKEHIYQDDIFGPELTVMDVSNLVDLRPFVHFQLDTIEINKDSVDGAFRSGIIIARFEQNVSEKIADWHAEVMRRFKNDIGQIVDAIQNDLTYLDVANTRVTDWYRADKNEVAGMGDFVACWAMFQWGTP